MTGRKGVEDVPAYLSVAWEECEESQQLLTAPVESAQGAFWLDSLTLICSLHLSDRSWSLARVKISVTKLLTHKLD